MNAKMPKPQDYMSCPNCEGRIVEIQANPGKCSGCGSLLNVEDNPLLSRLTGSEQNQVGKAVGFLTEAYGGKFELRRQRIETGNDYAVFKDGRRVGQLIEIGGGQWEAQFPLGGGQNAVSIANGMTNALRGSVTQGVQL